MVNTERTDLRISKVNGERTDSRPRRYPAPPTRPGCGVHCERADLRIRRVNGARTDSRPRRRSDLSTLPGCRVNGVRTDLHISRVHVDRTDGRPRRRSAPRAHPGCKGQTLVPPGCNGRGHVVPNRQSRCSRGSRCRQVRQNLLVVTRCHGIPGGLRLLNCVAPPDPRELGAKIFILQPPSCIFGGLVLFS